MAFSQKQWNEQHTAGQASSEYDLPGTSVYTETAAGQSQDARTLQALQALTDTALSHLSLEELLPELLERVRAVMQVDNVAILLLNEETQELDIRAVRGVEEESVGQIRIPVGRGFSGRIAATRKPLVVEDLSTYPVVNPLLREQLCSALGVPLLAGDRVLGVVHIGTVTPHKFTADEEALLEQVADRVARAVERTQLFVDAEAAQKAAEQRAAALKETLEALQERTRALEAVNAQLHTLLEVLPVGVAIVDVHGKPVLVNDMVRAIWGQNLPMAEGTSQYGAYRAWHVTTGEPVAADEWGLARALTNGKTTVDEEYTIEAFDGQSKTIHDSAVPLRDASGAITGAVSVIFDVTARRQIEQRTRASLEAFIAITRSLVEMPDEMKNAGRAEVGATGDVVPGETETYRNSNESPIARRLAELTRSVLGCSRVSITALEGEQLLSRPVAVVGLSEQQERQWWAEQEALSVKPVAESLMTEDRERLLAGEVMTFDLTRPPYEYPNAYGVMAVLAAPMRIQGRMVGLLGLDFEGPSDVPHTFTPQEVQLAEAVARLGAVVLERDRLLRERETARAEVLALTEANRRMDEFMGIAGHELRTPITTIKANLQLAERRARQILQKDPGESQKKGKTKQSESWTKKHEQLEQLEQLLRLLNRAMQSSERQERLVQDILDISRISSGWLEYRMAPYDLGTAVQEAIEEQRLNNPNRQIELEEPQEPLRVTADADRIGQVLTNYLTNAIKYSAAEQPISVEVCSVGSFVRVEVRDHGPGLSREQQRHLFERFHRAKGIEVVSGSGVGLGLGLYISKIIVEQHGGTVGVESVPGEGSVFWFTLPVLDAAIKDQEQPTTIEGEQ